MIVDARPSGFAAAALFWERQIVLLPLAAQDDCICTYPSTSCHCAFVLWMQYYTRHWHGRSFIGSYECIIAVNITLESISAPLSSEHTVHHVEECIIQPRGELIQLSLCSR
ncbi:hypothetical protein O6H91_17G039000 [Diphasiastrum complanatum]|uniref:Uncharacterized protein n=1 Tax=Diphasiastrum complanatum TaxID=34168 RepID=A0ACC2B6T0_DIPCM|nr:hypothetical protein O6H91_17G039000 [Diphasiastrum complanatum]